MSQQDIAVQLIKAQSYQTSHVFHLLMSLITMGCWIPIWLLVALSNSIERGRAMRRIERLNE